MLPPHGKYFNPIEVLFGDTKRMADERFRRRFKNVQPSKVGFANVKRNWLHAEHRLTSDNIKRAFKQRANGIEFVEVCQQKGLLD
jgi:hypothetical protein